MNIVFALIYTFYFVGENPPGAHIGGEGGCHFCFFQNQAFVYKLLQQM